MIDKQLIKQSMLAKYYKPPFMKAPVNLIINVMGKELTGEDPFTNKYLGAIYMTEFLFKYNTTMKDIIEEINSEKYLI